MLRRAIFILSGTAFLFLVLSCTEEQLQHTGLLANKVQAATTQPSITDLIPGGPASKALVGLIAGSVSSIAALWLKQKSDAKTAALEQKQMALAQVVSGVETAFPIKTPEQKLQLAAAQDVATQEQVAKIKTDIPKPA